jgi:U3 small nucleolar RNA-associated protein 5
MAEKLAALSLPADADGAEEEQSASVAVVPPSADSVHVLLRQALRADDRAALLGCLSNRDDKVPPFFPVSRVV